MLQTEIATYIEHTLLRPDTSLRDVQQLIDEALEYNMLGVCIPPYYIKDSRRIIKENPLKLVTVVGFPMGYNSTASKVEESKRAIDEGADELDMMLNLAAFKEKNYNFIQNDIQSVCVISHIYNRKVKLIVESGLLTEEELIKICDIAATIGVDYVKTSTGINAPGATVEAVNIIRDHLPRRIKVKASGGIKTRAQALAMINAGADRIGTSMGVHICSETTAELT